MKTKRPVPIKQFPWAWAFLFCLCASVSTLSAADTNAPAAAPPPLTQEQWFEGGTNTYNNWIELGTGGFLTTGSKSQAEQNQQSWDGAFGGIQDFHYGTSLGKNTTVTADGHALFNTDDYKLGLDLEQQNIGFLRFNYDEYHTWENGNGGYYPLTDAWYPQAGDALTMDHGQISFEAGLRLQNLEYMPKLTFKYTHTYENGDEPSTIWGYTHQTLPNTATVRGLSPSFYNLDNHSDSFQLDAAEHIKATDFGAGLGYETGTLNNSLYMNQWPGELIQQNVTEQDTISYNMFDVHAFTETWLKDNLMFSTGYSYSELNNYEVSGSRTYSGLNTAGVGYNDLAGTALLHDYVMDMNLYYKPVKNLSLVPSLRVEQENSGANANGTETFQNNPETPFGSHSDENDLSVCERLDLTYTGITNWVYYLRGEWTEGDGNLNQYGGLLPINGTTEYQSVQSQIDNNYFFQKYSAGCRWYPLTRVIMDVGGYYESHHYNSTFPLDSTTNNSFTSYRYPGYLVMQNFDTYDGNVRLTLRPWQNVSSVSRYEYQLSTIDTAPDPTSGLGQVESSRMTSQIIAQDVTWSPWSRLSLTAGFNFVLSETETPTSDYTQAVLNSQNNYWTVNCSADFVVDDKTDLNVSYYYYQADDYNNNATVGMPYGAGAQEHAVTAEIVRRITENLRLTVKSGYYHYTDDTSGGNNDFDSYLIFASMQYRF